MYDSQEAKHNLSWSFCSTAQLLSSLYLFKALIRELLILSSVPRTRVENLGGNMVNTT